MYASATAARTRRSAGAVYAVRACVYCLAALLILQAAPAGAFQFSNWAQTQIPDNASARRSLHSLLTGERSQARAAAARVIQSREQRNPVRFWVEEWGESLYFVFAHQRDGSFAIDSAGTYVLRRNVSSGEFDQIKVFLRDDPHYFARLFPAPDGMTQLDLYLADTRVYHRVTVGMRFERVMTAPFSELMENTRRTIAWSDLFPGKAERDVRAYRMVESMTRRIRDVIRQLPDAEDGAMDADGNLVFIESLVLQDQKPGFNCSGFAKWVVDGIYRQHTDSFLPIEPLKSKHLDHRGHRFSLAREHDRDPYFGLDWSRNLAIEIKRLRHPLREWAHTDADVRSVRFSRYTENVGYPVRELERILYLLAVQEPGWFYIGSVNREFGEAPVLRQHVHVVVLFPYFAENGRFEITVMERNVESSVASLRRRYGDDYIHLVRVQADEAFEPPVIGNRRGE